MSRRSIIVRQGLSAALVLLAGNQCTPPAPPDLPAPQQEGGDDSVLYVLQTIDLTTDQLAAAGFNWLILEPSRSSQDGEDFTRDAIARIRTAGPCAKTVLAYLSIGEAEDYRGYWNPMWVDANRVPVPGVAPAWLGPENPDWPGNYKVRYWDPNWQALLWGTPDGPAPTPLDRIIDQGFDGVYLDIVDAYDFWSSPEGGRELSRATARTRMIDLLEALARYARETRGVPGFLVFPQNATDIIRNDDYGFDNETGRYFAAISGIGQEDLFYDELAPQPAEETDYVLDQLLEFRRRGKAVLVTDYLVQRSDPSPGSNNARVQDFDSRCREQGFVPYAAYNDRALDAIVTFGGAGWDVSQPVACPNSVTASGG